MSSPGRCRLFRHSYSDHVIVYAFGRLDAPMSKAVPYIVQRIPILNIHHAVGDAVSKRMRSHVVGIATTAVDKVGLNSSSCSCLRDEIPDSLGRDPVARP